MAGPVLRQEVCARASSRVARISHTSLSFVVSRCHPWDAVPIYLPSPPSSCCPASTRCIGRRSETPRFACSTIWTRSRPARPTPGRPSTPCLAGTRSACSDTAGGSMPTDSRASSLASASPAASRFRSSVFSRRRSVSMHLARTCSCSGFAAFWTLARLRPRFGSLGSTCAATGKGCGSTLRSASNFVGYPNHRALYQVDEGLSGSDLGADGPHPTRPDEEVTGDADDRVCESVDRRSD